MPIRGYAPFQKCRMSSSQSEKKDINYDDTLSLPRRLNQYMEHMNRPMLSLRQLTALSYTNKTQRYQVEQIVSHQIQQLLDEIRDLKWNLLLFIVELENGADRNKVKKIQESQQVIDNLNADYDMLHKYFIEIQSQYLTSRSPNCQRFDKIVLILVFLYFFYWITK